MFGIFKKKTPLQKLQKQYDRLINESYELSTSNRQESDKKQAEAAEILKQIDALGN